MKPARIKNSLALGQSAARRDALQIIEAGLAAIDTGMVIRQTVRLEAGQLCVGEQICSLAETKRILVVAIGKCAVAAAEALEQICGERLTGGIALDVKLPAICPLTKIKCFGGTHPLPSDQNIEYTREIVSLLTGLDEQDLVIVVVSGGGSTLLCLPESDSCVEERAIVESLMRAGATIQEINIVRKHMSLARGGQLARYAYPAQVLGLIFSDVPGDDLSAIASGPTVLDTTTLAEADAVLAKYAVLKTCGLEHCGLIETPKDEKYFKRVSNILLVNNERALRAMADQAERLDYRAELVNRQLTGEAREVAQIIVAKLHQASRKTVQLYGGETTVTITGAGGSGGRNQELALAALPSLQLNELLIAVASDGHDNSDLAGGLVDRLTLEQAQVRHLDLNLFLTQHNSGDFFKQTGDFLLTGQLDSNVSDLILALRE